MMRLTVLDHVSGPGFPDQVNEDSFGWTGKAAFVLDGATPLGPSLTPPPGTDAAWLAQTLARELRARLAPGAGLKDALRQAITAAAQQFSSLAGPELEPWRKPVATLVGIRLAEGARSRIELFALGDSAAFVQVGAGPAWRWPLASASGRAEHADARAALARKGGFGAEGRAYNEAQALQDLRRRRALYNAPGGVQWLPGVEPEAARHLKVEPVPATASIMALLCTDGFAALVDHYGRHDPAGFIADARHRGLATLLAELRAIEQVDDPDGVRFPRFKRSDDATALLVRVDPDTAAADPCEE